MATQEIRDLRNAITLSGLSARRFANEILIRDERTIRRWLSGDSPIPKIVIDMLHDVYNDTVSGETESNPHTA